MDTEITNTSGKIAVIGLIGEMILMELKMAMIRK
jgi:hypothetical protein